LDNLTVPLSVFAAVLGFSRIAYVQFITDERLETLMACHEAAFAFIGGTPHEVLYDNMRTVVIGRDAYGPGRHRLQPGFRDFAHHHGFLPRLCRPYRAQTTDEIEQSFSQEGLLFSVCPRTTAWQRAGMEVKAPPRSLNGRPSFAAFVGTRRPRLVQPSVVRR
jgi:transposase